MLKIGDFRCEVLSTWFGCRFITLSVHLICLQHVCCDAVRRVGLSVTADPCITDRIAHRANAGI